MTELKKALAPLKDWSSSDEDSLPYFIFKIAPDALLNHLLIINSNTLSTLPSFHLNGRRLS